VIVDTPQEIEDRTLPGLWSGARVRGDQVDIYGSADAPDRRLGGVGRRAMDIGLAGR
jgi:hypothetical protein